MPSTSQSRSLNKAQRRVQYNVDTGAVISDTSVDTLAETVSWTRTSGVTPGWPKNIRTNAFGYQNYRVTYPSGYVITKFSGKPYIELLGVVRGESGVYFVEDFSFSSTDAVECEKRAVEKLLDNIKDQKVNIAMMLAERRETLKTGLSIVSNTAAFSFYLDGYLKSDNPKERKKFGGYISKMVTGSSKIKQISNLILTWKYGIAPVLQDVKGAAEKIADSMMDKPQVQVVRGKSSTPLRIQFSPNNPDYTISAVGHYDCTAYARFIVQPQQLLSSLGLTNPLALLWEATTLSFVVDWVLDISGFLSRLDATLGCSFVDGGFTTFQKGTVTTTSKSDTSSRTILAKGSAERIVVSRKPWGSFPLPPVPRLTNPTSLSHAVSAMALIVQRIK